MSTHPEPDALVSVRVAAELCGVPVVRVLSFLVNKTVQPVKVQGRRMVSLQAVERALGEGNLDPSK
jgi:hypothetical protein